jgi:hypothetical protein
MTVTAVVVRELDNLVKAELQEIGPHHVELDAEQV